MPDRRGIRLDPDQLIAFNPSRVSHSQTGSVDIVADLPIANMFSDVDENAAVVLKQGADSLHPPHSPCRIFGFRDATIELLALVSIRRRGNDRLYWPLELRQDIQGIPTMNLNRTLGEFPAFAHDGQEQTKTI